MLPTAIPRLDTVLGGGLPPGEILLVLGGAGTGKTTLGMQTAFHMAARGENVAFVSTFSEPPAKLLSHLEGFSFYDEQMVGKRLHVRNFYPLVGKSLGALTDALRETVEETGARLLILDGLASIRDVQDDREVRTFIYELGAALAALDATTLITSSVTKSESQHLPELTMADGVLLLGQDTSGNRSLRWLQVQKMRGRNHLGGRHSLAIDAGGIRLFPRLESLVEPAEAGLSESRSPFGLEALDTMMEGGPPTGSLTMVAGAPATGKTLVGLGFIAEGLARDENGVVITFRETEQQLVDRAAVFGMDLTGAVREERLRIIHRPPVDLDVDEVAVKIREEVENVGAQRLMVDTIDDLEAGILNDGRRRGYMAALATMLRQIEVTAVAVLEVPQVAGPELDLGGAPIAVFAENLLLLRNVEYRGRLLRILSVVKMRDSAFDSAVRQYHLTSARLQVMDPEETEPGLLEGISSLPSEARVKRGATRRNRG